GNTTGSHNTAIGGGGVLLESTTGNENVAIGYNSGRFLSTGSNNIDIANEVSGQVEAGTTRIGTERTQTRAFLAGIRWTPIAGSGCAVKVNEQGQLGCNPGETGSTGGGAAAVFGSQGNVVTGHCIGNSSHFEESKCPTTAGGDFRFTEGPVPAVGGSISN